MVQNSSRQIRSACAILASMLKMQASLHTLITEVEGILNSQALTVKTINDPGSFQPLSPTKIDNEVKGSHATRNKEYLQPLQEHQK